MPISKLYGCVLFHLKTWCPYRGCFLPDAVQCTIVNRKKLPVQKAVAAKKGALLLQAIKQTLRYGDIFTQYNTSRFLIILNHTKKENGKIVFNRIAKVYEELGGNRRDIDYQITPMYQE